MESPQDQKLRTVKTRDVLAAVLFLLVAAGLVFCAVWAFRLLSVTSPLAIIVGHAASIFAWILLIFTLLLICFGSFFVWAALSILRKKPAPVRPPPETDQINPRPYRRVVYTGLAGLAAALIAVFVASRVYSHPGIQIIKQLEHRTSVSALNWSPDGKRMATLTELFTHITVWDLENGTVIRQFDTFLLSCNCIHFTSDGNFIITSAEVRPETDRHAALVLWNARTGERGREVPSPFAHKAMSNAASVFTVSRDGKQLALSTNRMGSPLALYPEPAWTVPVLLNFETDHVYENDSATAMEFSPDGRQLVVGTAGNRGPGSCGTRVYLFDLGNRKIVWRKQVFDNGLCNIGAFAFSPDGGLIGVGLGPTFHSERRPEGGWETIGAEHPLVILDAATGEVVRRMPQASEKIWKMSWSPDGQFLAATQEDRSVRFWSMKNADQRPKRLGVAGWPMSVSFAPEGNRFAVGDGRVATIGEIARE